MDSTTGKFLIDDFMAALKVRLPNADVRLISAEERRQRHENIKRALAVPVILNDRGWIRASWLCN